MRKGTWKKIAAISLSLAMLGTAFTGCKKKDSSASGSGEVEEVVIGTQEMPNDEGIAKAKDLFEEKMGVKVKIVKFSSGKDVNNALVAKSIDFGLEGSTSTALAVASDIPVEMIWAHEILGDIESLAVRKSENIKSIKDLKGKKIAVPFATTSHYCLLRYMAAEGLTEKDITLLDMDTDSAYAAFKRGDVDAAWVWQPTLQKVLDAGGEILVSNGDAADKGYMTGNVEVVRKDFAEEHPDLVQKYIEALIEAETYYKENTDDAVSELAKALELTDADVKQQIAGATWPTAEEQLGEKYFGTSDKKGNWVDVLLDTANFLKDQKNINSVPDKSAYEEAVNPEYIEKALGK